MDKGSNFFKSLDEIVDIGTEDRKSKEDSF